MHPHREGLTALPRSSAESLWGLKCSLCPGGLLCVQCKPEAEHLPCHRVTPPTNVWFCGMISDHNIEASDGHCLLHRTQSRQRLRPLP